MNFAHEITKLFSKLVEKIENSIKLKHTIEITIYS